MDDGLCQILDWDSQHFGMRIARVIPAVLSPADVEEIDRWCARHSVACLYYLCPVGERRSAALAGRAGFEFVDLRVDMERRLSRAADGSGVSEEKVRRATQDDIAVLRQIAAVSHRDSRFYADPRFPRTACDELYMTWIEKSCRDPQGAVWTADEAGGLVGYVSCQREAAGVGRIGLVAVRQDLRGMGWGTKLLARALRWFMEEGLTVVRVATQGVNLGALALYGKAGFVPVQFGLWFHKWF